MEQKWKAILQRTIACFEQCRASELTIPCIWHGRKLIRKLDQQQELETGPWVNSCTGIVAKGYEEYSNHEDVARYRDILYVAPHFDALVTVKTKCPHEYSFSNINESISLNCTTMKQFETFLKKLNGTNKLIMIEFFKEMGNKKGLASANMHDFTKFLTAVMAMAAIAGAGAAAFLAVKAFLSGLLSKALDFLVSQLGKFPV